jgi:hypothetical protein
VLGIHPGPFTFGEIVGMAVDKEFSNWEKTATICHVVYQMHRDPKKSKDISALDFNPWTDETDRKSTDAAGLVAWDEMGVMFKRLNNGR